MKVVKLDKHVGAMLGFAIAFTVIAAGALALKAWPLVLLFALDVLIFCTSAIIRQIQIWPGPDRE